MTTDTHASLLPTGQTITFNNTPLHIAQLIGSGATSEVYLGTLSDGGDGRKVVIKAMKPLKFAGALGYFRSEAQTLSRLSGLEEKHNESRGLSRDYHVSPAFYGSASYADPGDPGKGVDYLVMAYLEGQQVPDLVAAAPDGRLPEAQALTLGFQLFHTLELLHTQLQKSYIDLKFENLWWQELRDGGGQLRMTDFGTLEDIAPGNDRGVRRDLVVAATYLCKMLTGIMPSHIAGELRGNQVPQIQRVESISLGSRQLLARLLHPNASARPRTAADVLDPGPPREPDAPDLSALVGLMNLADYWTRPVESLVKIKDSAWARGADAQGAARLTYLARARVVLDIWARRNPLADPAQVASEREQLDRLLEQSDNMANGVALFRAASDSSAETLFARGRSESYEPERIALFRRWGYATRIARSPGVSVGDEDRQDIERAIDLMNRHNWSAADAQWRQLKPRLGRAEAYQHLEADLALYSALDRAAKLDGDPAAAVSAYDDALAALERLPREEQEAILRDETGRLLPERDRLAEIAAAREAGGRGAAAMAKARAAYNDDNFPQARDHVRQALAIEDPAALPNRQRELTALVDKALNDGHYELAADLAYIALVGRRGSSELRRRWQLANELDGAQRDLQQGELPRFVARVDTIARRRDGDAPLSALLAEAIKKAGDTHDAELLRTLAELTRMPEDSRNDLNRRAQTIDAEWQARAEQNARQQRKRMEPVVDEALMETQRLLFLAGQNMPRPDFGAWSQEAILKALDDPRRTLEDAHRKALEAQAQGRQAAYRLDDAERLVRQAQNARAELDRLQQQVKQIDSRNRIEATQERGRLRDLAYSLSAPAASGDPEAQLTAAYDLLLGSQRYLTTVDPQDRDVQEWYERAAARFDYWQPQRWTELQREADSRVQRFHNALAAAEEAFARGETHRDGTPLSVDLALYGGTPEAAAFGQRLERAMMWRNFASRFAGRPATPYQPEPLAEVRRWLPLGLPAAFWANSAAAAWLSGTANAAATEAQQKMGLARQPLSAASSARPVPQRSPSGAAPRDDAYASTDTSWPATDWTAQNYSSYAGGPASSGLGPESYLPIVKWWFDADQTRRLATTEAAPTADAAAGWNAAAFLDAVAAAAQASDFAALQGAVESVPSVPDVDRALDEMSPELWRQALRRRPSEPDYNDTGQRPKPVQPRWMWPAIGGVAALIVLMLALAFAFRDRLGFGGGSQSTPTAIAQLSPTPDGGLIVQPTATTAALPTTASTAPPLFTPTATVPLSSPTASLTPTVVFTPTPSATAPPPEVSSFFQSDPTSIQPPPPVSDATLYLINTAVDVQPALDSGPWLTDTDSLAGEFFYIEDFTTPITMTWRHDQPLAEGLYQIYALDTTTRSKGTQRFEVRLDDQPAEPFRGQAEVTFGYSNGGQSQAVWLPIGAYQVATGQRLSVHVTAATDSEFFAVPALLVARLGDRERELLTALPDPSAGRPLVALLDDDNMERYTGAEPANDPVFNSGSSQWQAQTATTADPSQPVPPVWNGRYWATPPLTQGTHIALRAEWLPVGRQPAGQYQLWAYVPAGSTAQVRYEIVADGAPLAPDILLNQAQHAGQWIDISLWDLPAEARVSVYATAWMEDNQPGAIAGVDAVALLRVEK